MRKALKIASISLLGILLFNSCKNDLKIIAPYKEIPQVHAILTPQDPMQMIRINKIFLGEGDANLMAQEPDSINYKSGELTVMLERFVNGSKVAAELNTGKTELYFRDSLIQTEPGAFSTTQRVYLCNDRLFSDGIYKLTIKNNHTNNVFTATTTAIDSVRLTGFPPLAAPYYTFTPALNEPAYSWIDYSNQTGSNYIVRSKPTSGGFLHDLTIRIHYFDSVLTSVAADGKIYQSLDFIFPPQQLYEQIDFNNTKYFNFSFKGSALFAECGNLLSKRKYPSGFIGRKTYRVDFILYSATQDYYDYLQFSAPSISFAQEKTLYSNFDNRAAMGIFTFRTRCAVKKVPANVFVDEFSYNKYTCQYSFFTSNLSQIGCP
ncbi:MAG: DUF4249 family protein [Bacteroidia bacterium]|jgi:hypothetical protein|nr:DUF4249 family protein [Sphingobacteriaceae bacterium]MBP9070530.1 DUF4249 family protein [Bacteroidia bacterium]